MRFPLWPSDGPSVTDRLSPASLDLARETLLFITLEHVYVREHHPELQEDGLIAHSSSFACSCFSCVDNFPEEKCCPWWSGSLFQHCQSFRNKRSARVKPLLGGPPSEAGGAWGAGGSGGRESEPLRACLPRSRNQSSKLTQVEWPDPERKPTTTGHRLSTAFVSASKS